MRQVAARDPAVDTIERRATIGDPQVVDDETIGAPRCHLIAIDGSFGRPRVPRQSLISDEKPDEARLGPGTEELSLEHEGARLRRPRRRFGRG
jgi:hypothetical protein